MDKKISVKVCLGTTCFVMGSSNLQELIETVPAKYGDKVEVSGVPCLGLCSIDWEFSNVIHSLINSPYSSHYSLDSLETFHHLYHSFYKNQLDSKQ